MGNNFGRYAREREKECGAVETAFELVFSDMLAGLRLDFSRTTFPVSFALEPVGGSWRLRGLAKDGELAVNLSGVAGSVQLSMPLAVFEAHPAVELDFARGGLEIADQSRLGLAWPVAGQPTAFLLTNLGALDQAFGITAVPPSSTSEEARTPLFVNGTWRSPGSGEALGRSITEDVPDPTGPPPPHPFIAMDAERRLLVATDRAMEGPGGEVHQRSGTQRPRVKAISKDANAGGKAE